MPIFTELLPTSPWVELTTTREDWDAASPSVLGSMLTTMSLIRAFEESVLELAAQKLVHGPAHAAIGQEGAAAGAVLAMRPGDQWNGSHRAHHQFLAKALQFVVPEGLSPFDEFPAEVEPLLVRTLAEILGLAQGFCRGRGGSMHLRWRESGYLGTNAIVGGGVPFAAGAAWAQRYDKTGGVTFTCFGDGAINIGSVLETMNLAAAWKIPLCFFIENNRYAVATSVEESTAAPRLSSRGGAFGLPAWRVDGMDPLAVYLASRAAVETMRSGQGPTLIETSVYPYFHQNGPLPGSAFGYRSKEEEAGWKARDPIQRVAREMMLRSLLQERQYVDLRQRAKGLVASVVSALTEEKDGRRSISSALWPAPEFRDVGIRGDLSELADARTEEVETYRGKLAEARFVDTIAEVMKVRMSSDPRVVALGEDIHKLRGGTNGATRGLAELFPDRVLGTPISENAFVGLAGGMAVDGGFLPIVELMYPDFLWVAADQLFNQIAKARHMFGGTGEMPLVLRTKVAIGTGYGSQHSMDPAGIFSTSVGWRIVAPSTAFDYVGLFNAALRARDPVLVIEHVDLYGVRGPAPVDDLDYLIPLGKAKVVRQGRAVTVLTYLTMVRQVVEAAERMGIDAEVIDLRTLDRAGLDWAIIEQSVRKTRRVLVVEQGSLGTSYGGLLALEASTRLFGMLDRPVRRVHGGEAAPSVSRVLESAACAGPAEIEAGLRDVTSA